MTKSQTLNLINPKSSNLNAPVTVSWELKDFCLIVDFNINTPVQHEKKKFENGDYPYLYDVVEVFVAVASDTERKNFVYYEYEVTPNNQTYNVELHVNEGKRTLIENSNLDANTNVAVHKNGWRASFTIPLDQLKWNGDSSSIIGNFYSIVGKPGKRTYWSAFLGPQKKADFHKPESFRKLI